LPRGLVVAKWDEVEGSEVIGKYPENLVIVEEDIIRLFTSHAVGDKSEGYLYMSSESLNFSSYYAIVDDTPYLGALVLGLGEDPGDFKDIVPNYFSKMFLAISEGKPINEILETTYNEILATTIFSDEQKIFLVFCEPVGVQIFSLLTEEACTRSEILRRLEDRFGQAGSLLNLEYYISALKGAELVKEDRITGIAEPILFLVKDAVLYRAPPTEVINQSEKLPIEVRNSYIDDVKKFFETYEPDEEDSAFLAMALLDNKLYEVFKSLREDWYSFENLIENLQIDEEELEEILSKLESLDVIIRLSDEEKTYVLLKTDFKARTFQPTYMVDNITGSLIEGRIDRDIAIEHLKLLKKEFS